MKATLKAGLEATTQVVVDRGRTTAILGEDMRVYATPMMILDVEHACRNLVRPHFDPGEDCVGVRVEMEHLGPALPGDRVSIAVRLAEFDGRRLRFEASVRAGADEIGRGGHTRAMVDLARVRARLERKKAEP